MQAPNPSPRREQCPAGASIDDALRGRVYVDIADDCQARFQETLRLYGPVPHVLTQAIRAPAPSGDGGRRVVVPLAHGAGDAHVVVDCGHPPNLFAEAEAWRELNDAWADSA